MNSSNEPLQHIVVVGGGFAGTWAALSAMREVVKSVKTVRITLISRDEYLTIRPRLYETLSDTLRVSLAPLFATAGIHFQLGTAQAIDVERRTVDVQNEQGERSPLHYDRLVLAAGSEQRPLGIPGEMEFAWNIDTFAAAQSLEQQLKRVIAATDSAGRLTFVIVGAGFTGIELATEMRNRVRAHSDAATARSARIILLERGNILGADFDSQGRTIIESALSAAGVEIYLGASAVSIAPDAITLDCGERIETSTVIVTAGLRANALATQVSATLDSLGRVSVDDMLRVEGAPEVFAAGDLARAKADGDYVALMSCQHAITMGKFAGHNAARDFLNLPLRPYHQPRYVTCLDLGESGALFTLGWDRRIAKIGNDAKSMKRMINTQRIYPPSGRREAILAAADLDAIPSR